MTLPNTPDFDQTVASLIRVEEAPEWTEGVSGDGVAILRDGLPVTISELLEFLNMAENRASAFHDSMLDAEREACAKIVEEEGSCRHVEHAQGFCACFDKAAAIRARKS